MRYGRAMGGRITTKARGAHVPYEKKLTNLEKRMADASIADVLSKLANEFHSVGYSLGHDVAALMAMPGLAARASHGKLRANELAGEAYARSGDVRRAVFSMFNALETFPDNHDDRIRIVASIAEFLGPFDASAAAQLQKDLNGLPTEVAEARQVFANRMRVAQDSFDWQALPFDG